MSEITPHLELDVAEAASDSTPLAQRDLVRTTSWLVEMIEPDQNRPPSPRWWHPEHGWMWDACAALRFAREVDAADYIRSARGIRGKPTRHVFFATEAA